MLETGKYIIGSVSKNSSGQKGLSFSSSPTQHHSFQSARNEASRLANLYRGKSFVVCEVKGTVTVGGEVWS